MKHIFILLFILLAWPALTFGQDPVNKDLKLLSIFIYKIMLTSKNDTANKFTHFFAIKAEMNAQHKITKVVFSASTPAEIKDTLSKLKNLPVNWTNIASLKKGVKATVVIPVIDYKRTPSGMIRLASAEDLLVNAYSFEDGTRLYSNTKMVPNVWFLEPFYTVRYTEYPIQE